MTRDVNTKTVADFTVGEDMETDRCVENLLFEGSALEPAQMLEDRLDKLEAMKANGWELASSAAWRRGPKLSVLDTFTWLAPATEAAPSPRVDTRPLNELIPMAVAATVVIAFSSVLTAVLWSRGCRHG